MCRTPHGENPRVVFSTFSSAEVCTSLTLGLYLIGHLTQDLKGIAAKSQPEIIKALMTGSQYLCQNFELFNIKGQAVASVPISLSFQAWATVDGLLCVGLLRALACVMFQCREF